MKHVRAGLAVIIMAALVAGCECGTAQSADGGPDATIDAGPDAASTSDSGFDGGLDAGATATCPPAVCAAPAWRSDQVFGTNGWVMPSAVATARDGRVVVVGRLIGAADLGGGERTDDAPVTSFVASYASDGGYEWDHTFAGVAQDVAIGADGGVLVAGGFWGMTDLGGGERTAVGGSDGFLVRYAEDGSYGWDRTFPGPDDGEVRALAATPSSIVLAGRFRERIDLGGGDRSSAGGLDAFVARYEVDGNYIGDWTFGGSGDDTGTHIAASGGALAVTGTYQSAIDLGGGERHGDSDAGVFVLVLDREGSHAWDRVLSPIPSVSPMVARIGDVAVDADGSVVVSGLLDGYADFGGGARHGVSALFLARYAPDGAYLWDVVQTSDTGDYGLDAEPHVALTGAGDIVVVGAVSGYFDFGGGVRTSIGGYTDVFAAAYDGDGCYRWALRLGGLRSDGAVDVAAAGDRLALAGYFQDAAYFGGGVRTSAASTSGFVASFGPPGECCMAQRATCVEGDFCCTDLVCNDGACRRPFHGCGGPGDACCPDGTCQAWAFCSPSTGDCVPCGTPATPQCCPSGDPCQEGGFCESGRCRPVPVDAGP